WTLCDRDVLTRNGQLGIPGICDPNYVVPSFGAGALYPGMVCEESNQGDGGAVCQGNAGVTAGPALFTADCSAATHLDRSVTTPDGTVVDAYDFASPAKGGLKYDFPNCTGKCVEKSSFVESIYSIEAPQPGTYTITLTHFKDRTGGKSGQVALLID